MMVFKSLNCEVSSYMSDMFTRVSQTSSHVLQNSNANLRTPKLKTSAGRRCFSFRGVNLWNGLNDKAKSQQLLRKFEEDI